MAHKTQIDGTNYEITGGRTLVNSTGYSIKSGKTLVGGTAYEVGFSNMLTLTVKWEGGSGWVDHSELGEELSTGTYEVSPGSLLTCWVGYGYTPGISDGYGAVYVNGTVVKSNYYSPSSWDSYKYTITKNITVTFKGDYRNCLIYITEET